MRNTKLKSILQLAVVLSVLAGLLLCLNGCKKKKPDSTETESVAETSTETTPSGENTEPQGGTEPTNSPNPTVNGNTQENTDPTEGTHVENCEHVLGDWKVDKVSTCTTEGSRSRECELCGSKVEVEVIPKTSHAPGAWLVDKKATCTAEGAQHQECTQCKAKIAHIIVAKADHNTKIINGYAATTSTPGLTDGYWCSACGATVQEQFTISQIGSDGLTYTVGEDGTTCTITGFGERTDQAVILPQTINNLTVTAIGDSAFEGKTSIKTLYIPASVTKIGAKAFSGCSQLSDITYAGTTLEWSSLVKGAEWNSNTGSYTVYCTNNSMAK